MQRLFLTLLGLFFIIQYSYGQSESCHKSTEGTDFWFGFMESRNYQKDHYTEITVTSPFDCSCTIYIGESIIADTTLSIIANIPSKLTIDWKRVEAIGSESAEKKAIHLVANQPVNVYGLNWCPNSSDVALIFPTASLGKEYYVMCYTPHISGNGIDAGNGRNSEFLIVASQDSTTVTITPTKVTDQLKTANTPFQVTLNQGDVYQVQSENLPGTAATGQGDLTGSYITSDKPIAFYSGSLSTTVPGDDGVSAWDHLYEQIPPVQTWGRKFVAVPLMTRHEDTYRILASEDNTSVKIGTNSIVTLNKGAYYEFMLLYNAPALIESDKPVLLAQYSNSQSVDKTYTGGDGDPFMVIVSPVTQTRENVTFVAYDSDNIKDKYFINVVVKDDAVGNIVLDNTTTIPFTSLSGSGYSYAQVKISKGNHLIKATDPTKGFIAYVYGFGGVESYGYGVGYNLDIVLDLGSDILGSGAKERVRCDGAAPLTLNAGNGFDSYLWYYGNTEDNISPVIDSTEASIQVSDEGFYKVTAKTTEGCELSDTIKVIISKPVIDLGVDQPVCNPDTKVLDAGTGFTYSWTTPQGAATSQTVTASKTGEYTVVGTNVYGCKATDDIKLTFVDRPKIDLSNLQTLICGTYQTELDVSADKTVNWSLTGSTLLTINGLKVSVNSSNSGSYPVVLTATDDSTCASSESFDLKFYNTPTAELSIDSTTCQHYNMDVKYTGDAEIATTNFSWIFGGDTLKQGWGESAYTIPLGINRATRDLIMTLVDKNGCPNSKTISDIKVIPNLKMWVEDSVGCEPFTAKFLSDNTEIVDYQWNFGDGSSPGSTEAFPEHTYADAGYYPVTLKITTKLKGCTNEMKIDSMIYVAPIPTVGFTALGAECLETGNHLISYNGSGNKLDTYHWDLSAFDPGEIIQNPDTTQGPFEFDLINHPQANIGLSVKSSYGCLSDTATVLVKRKPVFSINSTSVMGCAPLNAYFSAQTGDPVDQVNYKWDFGDDSPLVDGTQVTHDYLDPDHKYSVALTATSSTTGCSDVLSQSDWVWTYPKPSAVFEMDHKIVYSDLPDVKFTDLSLGDPVSWLWNFGDGVTSSLQNPSYHFVQMGHQQVTFEVTNAFGCTDGALDTVLVAFDRLFPPTGFSPKAPMAIDREFKLYAEGVDSKGYHLSVLSRWNDLVFEARDVIAGWDGRMKNGDFAPAGTYVWVLDYIDFLGRPHRQSGNVTLVY